MNYKEYKEAALRHRITCEFLLRKLKDQHELLEFKQRERILHNIYYLSGYIIECIISYSFFEIIKFDKNRSVYELDNNNQYGYTFRILFKDHSNLANANRLDEIRKRGGSISSNIPILGEKKIDKIFKDMYEQWNAQVRYSILHLGFELTMNNIEGFYKIADDIYINLRKI